MTALDQHRETMHGRGRGLRVGLVLIAIGLIAFVLEQASVDIETWLGGSGWTLFVIGPGVLLLAFGLLMRGNEAQGMTTAGAIVTAIGLLLLYQNSTGHWESWAYAWAVIPGAAGLSLVLHAIKTGSRELFATGTTMAAIAGAMLIVGAWYFETVFRTGSVPFDLGDAWPLVLVVLGAIVILASLVRRPNDEPPDAGPEMPINP